MSGIGRIWTGFKNRSTLNKILMIIALLGFIIALIGVVALFIPGNFLKFKDTISGKSPQVSASVTYVLRLKNNEQLTLTKDNYQSLITKLRKSNIVPPEHIADYSIESFANVIETNSCFTVFPITNYGEGRRLGCVVVPSDPPLCENCLEAALCILNSGTLVTDNAKIRFCINDEYYISKSKDSSGTDCITLEENYLFPKNETKGKPFIIKKIVGENSYDLTNIKESFEGIHKTWGKNNKITDFYEIGLIVISNCGVVR